MFALPQYVSGVTHPLVAGMYVKKDFSENAQREDVLVIEARFDAANGNQHDDFKSCLIDLLGDLEDLKGQAEKKVGHIDRVDIKAPALNVV